MRLIVQRRRLIERDPTLGSVGGVRVSMPSDRDKLAPTGDKERDFNPTGDKLAP